MVISNNVRHSTQTALLKPVVPQTTTANSSHRISLKEAVDGAINAVGLANYDPENVQARTERLTADILPFLGDQLHGKETWVLDFTNLILPVRSGGSNKFIRSLKVILAPDSIRPLTIVSEWPQHVAPMAPIPPTKEIARQFSLERHTYTGLPDNTPTHSLLEVLNGPRTMGWNKDTKQMVVYFVTADVSKYKNRPMWIVQLRGFGEFSPYGASESEVPASFRDHLTNAFDAETGQWYSATTTPQPILEHLHAPPGLE